MTRTVPEPAAFTPQWLALREPADAEARSAALLGPLRARLGHRVPAGSPLVVHDLGCGTGAMSRWLVPRLPGPQHWNLHDHDPDLARRAAEGTPASAADGSRVTAVVRDTDVGRLSAAVLADASLVTASALLDILTAGAVDALAAACAGAGCPALLTLSVLGRVELTPAHPADTEVTDAFNAHQRRGGLLGPDAVPTTTDAFARQGMTVRVHASPWRLAAGSPLLGEWLRGWVGAAREQRPDLAGRLDDYLARRLAADAAGELSATVHHADVLALPRNRDTTS
ncbi:SAM-dependent methyltransferase [Streptomyces sp. NPDC058171]